MGESLLVTVEKKKEAFFLRELASNYNFQSTWIELSLVWENKGKKFEHAQLRVEGAPTRQVERAEVKCLET